MIVTPLYGHNSEEKAFVIDSYPYGKLRCQMKVWLETHVSKGIRFVSRTQNPKTGVWNAPKKSTYALLAGNMYVDEVGHVQWSSLNEYSDYDKVRDFITSFPQNPELRRLKVWVGKKITMYSLLAKGECKMSINGVIQEPTQAELDRHTAERDEWASILHLPEMKAIYPIWYPNNRL